MYMHPVPYVIALVSVCVPLIATAQQDTGQSGSSSPATVQGRASAGSDAWIFGSQLMSAEERAAYRARMRAAKTGAEREQIRAEHHEEMMARAKEQGVTLPEMSSGGGAPGRGMGPGYGERGPR